MNTANVYCAPNDIIDILSSSGLTLRSDDAPPSTYGNAVVKAGNKIDFHCSWRYDPTQLAVSPLVLDWAAAIAAYYVCIRRGNPPPEGIAILYEQSIDEMKDVLKGRNQIPGIAPRKQFAPVMSIMRATSRPYNRAVVETDRQTTCGGLPANYHQHRDAWDLFGGNCNEIMDFSV